MGAPIFNKACPKRMVELLTQVLELASILPKFKAFLEVGSALNFCIPELSSLKEVSEAFFKNTLDLVALARYLTKLLGIASERPFIMDLFSNQWHLPSTVSLPSEIFSSDSLQETLCFSAGRDGVFTCSI